MSIDEPVHHGAAFNSEQFDTDQRALLQAVVVQLHQVTERVATLELQLDQSSAAPATNTQTQARARVRRSDPHSHRQTGWQPTRR